MTFAIPFGHAQASHGNLVGAHLPSTAFAVVRNLRTRLSGEVSTTVFVQTSKTMHLLLVSRGGPRDADGHTLFTVHHAFNCVVVADNRHLREGNNLFSLFQAHVDLQLDLMYTLRSDLRALAHGFLELHADVVLQLALVYGFRSHMCHSGHSDI